MADLSQKSFGQRNRLNEKTDADLILSRNFVAKRLSAISSAKLVTCPSATAELRGHRERAPRKEVHRVASIFTSRIDGIKCIVVNLSADGAQITMEGSHDLPEFITLRFEQSGVERKARIAWRQDPDIGLSFLKDEDEDVEPSGDNQG